MGSLTNLNTALTGISAARGAKAGQQAASTVEHLLAEQRMTNRLLYALLSPEQQQAFDAQEIARLQG